MLLATRRGILHATETRHVEDVSEAQGSVVGADPAGGLSLLPAGAAME